MSEHAERDLIGEVRIDADADAVWAVLADPHTMVEVSPEVFAVNRRGTGPYRPGETFIGWNRLGVAVWPTRNVVTVVEPGRRLAWHTKSSGAVWNYTLDSADGGTVLREERHVPHGVPLIGRTFARLMLGGVAKHSDALDGHVSATLEGIKRLCEGGGR